MATKKTSIEDNLKQVNEIIEMLSNDETPLNEAIDKYKKGIKIIRECQTELDAVEQQIIDLSEDMVEE